MASLGDVALNIDSLLKNIVQILDFICMATGAGLLFGAAVQYHNHRRNPTEVRLSVPIAMLITGAALIVLVFIPMG